MIQTVMEQTGITDREIIAELINEFFRSGFSLVDDLQSALSAENCCDVCKHAHNLKGMAGNLGFKTISGYAEQLEQSAQNNDIQASDNWLNKLQYEIVSLRTAWNKD